MNDEVTLGRRGGGELPKLPRLQVWSPFSTRGRVWPSLLFVNSTFDQFCQEWLNWKLSSMHTVISYRLGVKVAKQSSSPFWRFLQRTIPVSTSCQRYELQLALTVEWVCGVAGPEPWMAFGCALHDEAKRTRHGTARRRRRVGGVFENQIIAAWLHLARILEAVAKCSTNSRSGLPCMTKAPFPSKRVSSP